MNTERKKNEEKKKKKKGIPELWVFKCTDKQSPQIEGEIERKNSKKYLKQ